MSERPDAVPALPDKAVVARAVQEARGLIATAKLQHRPAKTIVLFSGGNDSATLFHLVRDLVDYAAHIETGIGIPATRAFVAETAHAFNVPIIWASTPPSVYEDLVLKGEVDRHGKLQRGFPGPGMHFKFYCRLKERRLDDLKRRFVGRRGKGKILFLTGLRISESKRRKMHIGQSGPIHPAAHSPRMIFCNPILNFTPELLMAYREWYDVPRSPVADLIHMSGECLCGCYAHPGEIKELEMWFPKTAARIHALEAKAREAGVPEPYCRWGHTAEPLRGLGGRLRTIRKRRHKVGVLCQSCEVPNG